jgi:hypothetical protein
MKKSVFQGGWHGTFVGRMVGAPIFDFAEPDLSAILWHVPSFLRAHTGPIIPIMSPALLTPEKECYTVLILQIFREGFSRGEKGFRLKERAKRNPVAAGPAYEKSLRSRRLAERGIQRSERERTKIGLTLTSLKSSTFVNLHLVIKGPNEFAKDHQTQRIDPFAGG